MMKNTDLEFEKIINSLNTSYISKDIVYKKVINSTNTLAKENSAKNSGTVFIAEAQTMGSGRLGRSWNSQKNVGLYLSILLKPKIHMNKVSQITLITAVALIRAINDVCKIDAKIKWPNDIIINGKKVCGILCSSAISENEVDYIVCGVGINVNNTEFPYDLADKATSLAIELSKNISREDLYCAFMNNFEKIYDDFLVNGFLPYKNEYEKNCITVGCDIFLEKGATKEKVFAKGITADGELVVIGENGEKIVSSGEVSVRGVLGYI